MKSKIDLIVKIADLLDNVGLYEEANHLDDCLCLLIFGRKSDEMKEEVRELSTKQKYLQDEGKTEEARRISKEIQIVTIRKIIYFPRRE